MLAALFGVDAFAGGFVVQSMLALWLLERFGLDVVGDRRRSSSGPGFCRPFPTSSPCGSPVRLGLVNTMVFTHLPSSLLLLLVPFVPTSRCAIALLLARSALSQMDVPTRNSYVMAVVTPAERAAAASITSLSRSLASSARPVHRWLAPRHRRAFGWPLIVAGALKIVYDLSLLATFGRLRPPEESAPPSR